MTNEVPKNLKTYIVLDDGETYAEIEGCTLVMVTEAGEELLENMDGIKSLLRDYEPDGLYNWAYVADLATKDQVEEACFQRGIIDADVRDN